jgi:V/A-type H+-transporting ATPase subunit I
VLAIYVSALAAPLEPRALALTGLGLLWYLAGVAQFGRGAGWRRLVWGTGRLLQSALELTLNTLSFIRVGAFALAHSALSHAVVDIADSIDGDVGRWVFLVVGHGLLIAVEGLVVFIQTTRLILFEFFTRFLRAEGRLFRPVDAPGNSGTQPRRHDDRR